MRESVNGKVYASLVFAHGYALAAVSGEIPWLCERLKIIPLRLYQTINGGAVRPLMEVAGG